MNAAPPETAPERVAVEIENPVAQWSQCVDAAFLASLAERGGADRLIRRFDVAAQLHPELPLFVKAQ
jgi:hypothetical protein